LDPTLRKLSLSKHQHIVLADTVGFIQNLPHDLVDAFHATLQETIEADLLLHVVDASDDQKNDHIEQVNLVLKHINADQCPQILVLNKIDQTQCLPHVDIGQNREIHRVWISALKDQGISLLTSALKQYFDRQKQHVFISLPMDEQQLRTLLYKNQAVIHETFNPQGTWEIEAQLNNELFTKMTAFIRSSSEHDTISPEADFSA